MMGVGPKMMICFVYHEPPYLLPLTAQPIRMQYSQPVIIKVCREEELEFLL